MYVFGIPNVAAANQQSARPWAGNSTYKKCTILKQNASK